MRFVCTVLVWIWESVFRLCDKVPKYTGWIDKLEPILEFFLGKGPRCSKVIAIHPLDVDASRQSDHSSVEI